MRKPRVWMVKLMNDISTKADELIEAIKQSDTYKKYISLKKQMIENKEIMNSIDLVKKLQKDIVRKNVSTDECSKIDKEIDQIISRLHDIPLYVEYDYVQKELNNTLQIVKSTIEGCINDITK